MTEMQLLQTVTDLLNDAGLTASLEYPGWISVWAEDLIGHGDRHWAFGDANATWTGDLNDATGYLDTTLDTGLTTDCTDPATVAAAIIKVLQ